MIPESPSFSYGEYVNLRYQLSQRYVCMSLEKQEVPIDSKSITPTQIESLSSSHHNTNRPRTATGTWKRSKIAFLKSKTPKEIAQIQACLEDLPIAQQISIKKAIKWVLEELENI